MQFVIGRGFADVQIQREREKMALSLEPNGIV